MADLEMSNVTLGYAVSGATTGHTSYATTPVLIKLPHKIPNLVDRTNTASTVKKTGKGLPEVTNMTARWEYTSELLAVLEGQRDAAADVSFKATIASGDYQIWEGSIFAVEKITETGKPAYIDVEAYSNSVPVTTPAGV